MICVCGEGGHVYVHMTLHTFMVCCHGNYVGNRDKVKGDLTTYISKW